MFTQTWKGSKRSLMKVGYESEFIPHPAAPRDRRRVREWSIGIIRKKISKPAAKKNLLYPPYQVISFTLSVPYTEHWSSSCTYLHLLPSGWHLFVITGAWTYIVLLNGTSPAVPLCGLCCRSAGHCWFFGRFIDSLDNYVCLNYSGRITHFNTY